MGNGSVNHTSSCDIAIETMTLLNKSININLWFAVRTTVRNIVLPCVCVLVPSSAPLLGMSRNLSSTSILVSWYAPVEPNGEIIEYAAVLHGPRGSNSTYTPNSQLTLTHLTPYTAYNLSISAVNRKGMGPSLMLPLHTDEAGECCGLRVWRYTSMALYICVEIMFEIMITPYEYWWWHNIIQSWLFNIGYYFIVQFNFSIVLLNHRKLKAISYKYNVKKKKKPNNRAFSLIDSICLAR